MQQGQFSYEEQKAKSKVAWDDFSNTYYSSLNRNSLSLMNTLMALTRIYQKNNILDIGCGPGYGTKLLTSDVPNTGSNIYAMDFSPEMLKLAHKIFSEYDDFNSNLRNFWDYREEDPQEKINIEKDLEDIRKEKIGKVVRFLEGNAECLRFEDAQFEVYISNLCLMLCINVEKAIKESFRVLKNDGIAAFTIWGKKIESKLILSIFEEVFQQYEIDMSKERSSFWLAEDPENLKKKFLEAGFKEVRIEYTTEIYDCFDEADFCAKFKGPRIKAIFDKLNDEKKAEEILDAVRREAKKQFTDNQQMPTLNVMTILAFK